MPTLKPATVLVVDDERAIRRLLRVSLEAEGYGCIEAATAADALRAARHHRPDVILLDLGLPDRNGMELIDAFRELGAAPIIVLTARDAEASKVTALDAGADDYITKPFGVPELLARLRAALRHRIQAQGGRPRLEAGSLVIDLMQRRVTRTGRDVALTPKEWAILEVLALHSGKVVTHGRLVQQVWGHASTADQHGLPEQQAMRVHIRQLRRKLELDPDRPQLIVTEPGVGYRFLPDD